jgi:hypothetical protein
MTMTARMSLKPTIVTYIAFSPSVTYMPLYLFKITIVIVLLYSLSQNNLKFFCGKFNVWYTLIVCPFFQDSMKTLLGGIN